MYSEGSLWLVMINMHFLLLSNLNDISFGHVRKCVMLYYPLVNIFIRFGLKLHLQSIGIPMDTYCAPLVANLFLSEAFNHLQIFR